MNKRDGSQYIGQLDGRAPARMMAIAGVGVVVFQTDAEPVLIDQNTGAFRKLVPGSISPDMIERARDDLVTFGHSERAAD